jgi:biopolymer transport protein TolQ
MMDDVNITTLNQLQDWSIWGLFWQADLIVQLVMVFLLLASFWSWSIIFSKIIRLRQLRTLATQFEENFWSGGSLDSLYDRLNDRVYDPMASTFVAAMREWKHTPSNGRAPSKFMQATLQQRIDRVMQMSVTREMENIESHMGFLASVGATAPFIGLFGTVWGIINSFQGIAASQSTNLAVVAPGIAEALFATALGLITAIPAVIAYNKLSNDITLYGSRLEGFVNEFCTIVSRQLEEA